MNHVTNESEAQTLTPEFTDEEMERAGTSHDAPGMSSLWSSYSVAGCTCISGV